MRTETKSKYSTTLRKAVSILRCFSAGEPELSGTEIARRIGVHKATAHRILNVLSEEGLVIRNENSNKYSIGPELFVLGSIYLSTADLLTVAEPAVKALNDLANEDVNVGILNDGHVTVIMKAETTHRLRCSIHVGTIMPAYASAMGLALLSELNDSVIDSLYPEEKLRPLTSKTIATKTELKLLLAAIRKSGTFCQPALSGAGYEGVEGISSVIRDNSGQAVAAMSFSVPEFRMNPARRKQLITLLGLGVSLISYRLGYQDMANPVRDIGEIRSLWEHNQPYQVAGELPG